MFLHSVKLEIQEAFLSYVCENNIAKRYLVYSSNLWNENSIMINNFVQRVFPK